MSNLSQWFQKTPQWLYWSLFPVLGGLAIVYAGSKTKTQSWVYTGLGFVATAFILSNTSLSGILWIAQIATAIALKKEFLAKTYPNSLSNSHESHLIKLIAKHRDQIDINNCSKHDLVHGLDLPIVYANEIEEMKREGYNFTSLEELGELIGIPEATLNRIEPLVSFGFDINKEIHHSWRRLNVLSMDELVSLGLHINAAKIIVLERQQRGSYKSFLDFKKRAKLPLHLYRHLL
ncbi:MAG: helix-hairpin-helix domain-containing protein [Planktothrix sp.]